DLGRLAGINRPRRALRGPAPAAVDQLHTGQPLGETAWAGVMQTRLERRHNIFIAAVLTAIPFGFIHWPLAFLSDITIASVLISLAAYILLGLFLRPLVGVVLRGSRDSLLASGLMHTILNPPNNNNALAAALLNGQLYRLGILIAVVVLIAALALL